MCVLLMWVYIAETAYFTLGTHTHTPNAIILKLQSSYATTLLCYKTPYPNPNPHSNPELFTMHLIPPPFYVTPTY
ncbi:hypothetical protein B484DRAFT_441605 [Ochromonadaceae sp. CCMP2298]|nr:hypothetical protein B484DRAFT_441605 [Ochromonadaceae sp. CCMP2298]